MKILFKNANIVGKKGESVRGINIFTDNDMITYVETDLGKIYDIPDRVVNSENYILIPGLYNMHTHLPMSVFKGYAEDMPLDKWLFNKIFPAEDKLNEEIVYYASLLGIAEQIQNGVISCSDMYFFTEAILMAADESFIKINASRAVQSFDENENISSNRMFNEAKAIYKNYHNTSSGRIKIDMSIHAEYTSNEKIVRAMAEFSNKNRIINHVHISETKKEHEECILRHNMTPIEYFNSLEYFETPTIAAHCVYVTERDMEIMDEKGVTAVHNPSSNLKLASGVAPVSQMIAKGVNVAIGTDGSAANNNLDILKELYLASILQKGITADPEVMPSKDMLQYATQKSAIAQGRYDSGFIAPGMKADITALDMSSIEACPVYDYNNMIVYSMNSGNVKLTMCDGKILYEKGEFKTIDIEKVKYKVHKLKDKFI